MTREELKTWTKEKVKGNIWNILPAIIIASIITNLSFTFGSGDGRTTYSIGFLFFFVEVGLNYFMINFITDRKYELNDIFYFKDDFGKDLGVGIVRNIFVFLWLLLLVVPGIIKAIAYKLVPILLTDSKYKGLSATDILKKSEEMMNGHKMDSFILD